MKNCLFPIAIALLMLAPAYAQQQEGGGGIKVISTLHDDGSRTDMQTDLDNHTAESKTYSSSKKLIQRSTFNVDDKGQIMDGIIYDPKGNIIGQIAYTRDDSGRVTEQFDKAPNGALLRRLVYHYDANGRVAGIDAYDANGNLLKASGSSSSKKKTRSGTR